MISTGTLMLGKALLTASAALGFCFWQLWALRRDRLSRQDEADSGAGQSSRES